MLRCIAFVLVSTSLWAQAPRTVVKITGSLHKLVLFSDGTVGGWGDTRDGQLGPIAPIPVVRGRATTFVPIMIPGKAVDIAATDRVSYALLSDGTVLAFGWGLAGGLGCGEKCLDGHQETPTAIPGLRDVVQIAAGDAAAFAIHRDGMVSAWGSRDRGMIPDGVKSRPGNPAPKALTPVKVPKLAGLKQITVGGIGLGVTVDGRVISWGLSHPALGRMAEMGDWLDAGEVPGLTDVVSVVAIGETAAALKKDGTVWVWGSNDQAGFGNGQLSTNEVSRTPLRVPGLMNVTSLVGAQSGRQYIALLKDGTIRAWGNTDWGQGGAGISGTSQPRPSAPKISGVKAVFAAGNNSFAVREDNSVWIWGAGFTWRGGGPEWPLGVNTKTPAPLALPAL
jgi:alpha-tubulin suppressor-like RCC1 family protein